MSGKTSTGVSVGGSSILVIFVLLCLTTFATLSLVSANADLALTRKTAQATGEFYAADAQAEEIYADIAAAYGQSGENIEKMKVTLAAEGLNLPITGSEGDTLSYSVPVGDGQELHVTLAFGGGKILRKRWCVVNTAEYDLGGEELNLWGGENDLVLFQP